MENRDVNNAVEAANESMESALIIEGASPDDVTILRRALMHEEVARQRGQAANGDDALSENWRQGGYPYLNRLRRKTYERQKYDLQRELLKLQRWVKETGARVVILFEGRDAAGEMVLFDRSWYNRAGVERVMGFCTDEDYAEFIRQAPEFERNLVRSGIHVIKFWFSVSRDEQRRRFKEREAHPLKQWKLSPIDMASLDKWDDYTAAKEQMFFYTDISEAPWIMVKSDCKKRARLNAMRYTLHHIPH